MGGIRSKIEQKRRNRLSQGEEGDCLKSFRLEPVPRQQKSPWLLHKTVVTTRRKIVEWWNGGLAGTRTLDQCLKRALLYQLSYQPILLFINDFRRNNQAFNP